MLEWPDKDYAARVALLREFRAGKPRAVALALGRAGANVRVCARHHGAAVEAAGLAGGTAHPWEEGPDWALRSEIVVNATPIGMDGRDPGARPIPETYMEPGHAYVDLVYHPLETPFLRAARSYDATAVDGLGMLVHQAALQVERWTGCGAPVEAMRSAAKAALLHSR